MALLSFDEENERSDPHAPFANGYEGESWMSLWCEDGCANYKDCPLILVALLGRTPQQWEIREPGGLNRYTCHAYTDPYQEPAS